MMKLKIGDCVRVKDGLKDPDNEYFEIGGWQGRVVEIDDESDEDGNTLITIEWDSLTLKQMPAKFIQESEKEGLDWQIMNLSESDLDKTVPRDKKGDVEKMQDLISDKFQWIWLGEEGLRIANVLEGVNPHDYMRCFQKWDQYLGKKLSFPIKAIVIESEDEGILENGDEVEIKSLSNIVDLYGIIVKVKFKGKSFETPLCELEVIDKNTPEYQLISDYEVWFGNR